MKALSKPISSPGRAEKFPTPLMMRFLRTNVGSRSRGRSRSSPMFILRSKKNGNAPGINETQQEPSSPKVTCIGQVRVRRSSKSKKNSSKSKKNKEGRSASACSLTQPYCLCYPSSSCNCSSCSCSCSCCYCCCGVPRNRIFGCFSCRFPKPKSFYNPFRKCLSFFHFGYCKKVNTRDDSSRFGSINHRNQNNVTAVSSTPSDIEEDFCDRNIVKGAQLLRQGSRKQGFPQSCSPPKNALLLTRCRSAPYRSSSLASRFWGSPLRSSSGTETPPKEEEEEEEPEEPPPPEEKEEDEEEEGKMGRRPISPKLVNEEAESRNSGSHEEKSKESDSTRNERPDSGVKIGKEFIHPLLLTRCKSEPARTGERLNPEANLFTQRRSDTAESCLQLPQIHCD